MLRTHLARGIMLTLIALVPLRTASGQEFSLPQLIPGGADRVFDILGIAPGMNCDAAKSQMVAKVEGKYGQPSPAPRTKSAKISGSPKSMEATIMALTGAAPGHVEKIWVECSSKVAANQVYLVWRTWEFTTDRPPAEQLKANLEEKYGRFTSVFSKPDGIYATYAILYNTQGRIDGPDNSCGAFLQNMPEAAIAQAAANIEVAKCSFALSASFELLTGKDRPVRRMLVSIWDYMRFSRMIDYADLVTQEKNRLNPKPLPRW
jgi:hypothetical protein